MKSVSNLSTIDFGKILLLILLLLVLVHQVKEGISPSPKPVSAPTQSALSLPLTGTQMGGARQGSPLNLKADVSTLAGTGAAGTLDDSGNPPSFLRPAYITAIGNNIYVVDLQDIRMGYERRKVRKIEISTGNVTTLAGTGKNRGIDTHGRSEFFSGLSGITAYGDYLYLVDTDGRKIHKVSVSTGEVATIAGSGASGSQDGSGKAASFNQPENIATDGSNLYVVDYGNHNIRKISISTGTVTTVAGTGSAGSADGTGEKASFNKPNGITTYGGNLYVADNGNSVIRKIVIATGEVTTFASADSFPTLSPRRANVWGITTDGSNLYVTDAGSNVIYKIVIATREVSVLAGSGVEGAIDGIGVLASFNRPADIKAYGSNLYVSDELNNTIRKIIISTGEVTTLAGSGEAGGKDGVGTRAPPLFNWPHDISSDGSNLYVADTSNNKIRKIVIATREVSTLAGSGTGGSDDGKGMAASFSRPMGITTDGSNVYVSDSGNNKIRKIVISTGEVNALAGSGASGSADGAGAEASFNGPMAIATDGINLYVADYGNHKIRKVMIATGEVTTLAGSGTRGSDDGTGKNASFNHPTGITKVNDDLYVVEDGKNIRKIVIATSEVTLLMDTSTFNVKERHSYAAFPWGITTDGSNLYVTDITNHKIRKISLTGGEVISLAGPAGSTGNRFDYGLSDGVGGGAFFYEPKGITSDGNNLYVADSKNNKIRKIVIATGAVTTLAGLNIRGFRDGSAMVEKAGMAASFNRSFGVTADGSNLYVADSNNHKIRKIALATGIVTTLAGSVQGSADGTGKEAFFSYPYGITTDGNNLYVADSWNNKIRKIDPATGVVTTLAGSETKGSLDAKGTAASFDNPTGITTDGSNLYVADTVNHKIRRIVIATGEVTTFAGTGTAGSHDAKGTAAAFNFPEGLTTDGSNIYVADTSNHNIRKIVIATGEVTTLAGSGTKGFDDGTGKEAKFFNPVGITSDGINLYVADTKNNTLRKIVIATGAVTTLAGTRTAGSLDATGTAAMFNLPKGITTDGNYLYVADTENNKIRKIQ